MHKGWRRIHYHSLTVFIISLKCQYLLCFLNVDPIHESFKESVWVADQHGSFSVLYEMMLSFTKLKSNNHAYFCFVVCFSFKDRCVSWDVKVYRLSSTFLLTVIYFKPSYNHAKRKLWKSKFLYRFAYKINYRFRPIKTPVFSREDSVPQNVLNTRMLQCLSGWQSRLPCRCVLNYILQVKPVSYPQPILTTSP